MEISRPGDVDAEPDHAFPGGEGKCAKKDRAQERAEWSARKRTVAVSATQAPKWSW
jgi:hypothetical protein